MYIFSLDYSKFIESPIKKDNTETATGAELSLQNKGRKFED